MRTLKSILVALNELPAKAPPVLARAALIAKGTGAKLELFHALAAPVFVDIVVDSQHTLNRYTHDQRERARLRLERLAVPPRDTGLKVSTHVAWDYPPYEAIVRRALVSRADLIIAARRGHHRFPAMMGYTDWELLRASPVPVLLTRSRRHGARASIVAAVDPWHIHAKPADLDRRILGMAADLGSALSAPLHIVHVLEPWRKEALDRSAQRKARAEMAELACTAKVPTARLHLLHGEITERLPKSARALRAGIVVMGDMSRRGLRGFFVGDTAERLIDELKCDLLVVKPAGFTSRLARRPRGMYLMTNLPLT